jgi:hypothetical protein
MLADKNFEDFIRDEYLAVLLNGYFQKLNFPKVQFTEIKRILDLWHHKPHNGETTEEILAMARIDSWPPILHEVIDSASEIYDRLNHRDKAQITPRRVTPGGIDLNPAPLKMAIERDLSQEKTSGFQNSSKQDIFSLTPQIIKLEPIQNILEWVG